MGPLPKTDQTKAGEFNAASMGIPMQDANALFDHLVGKSAKPGYFTAARYSHGIMGDLKFLENNDQFKAGLFGAFKDPAFLKEVSQNGGTSFDGAKLEKIFKQVEAAGPDAQAAVNKALSNPEFIKHIATGGAGELMSEDTLKEVLNGPHKGYALQLLNQIGTNPMFKGQGAEAAFKKVDALGENIKAYGEATKGETNSKDEREKEKHRREMMRLQTMMVEQMRDLGVNVPEDVSPEILGAFKNIFMYGMSTDQAMDNMMVQLAKKGVDPKAIESMDAMMRPMAGMMDFIAQPYAEFFRKHGGTLMDKGNSLVGHMDNVQRGIFGGEGFVRDMAQRDANVLKFQADFKARDEGMDGAAKRVKLAETFGLKSDKDGNLSVEADRERELAAMDAQRRMNPTPALSIGGP